MPLTEQRQQQTDEGMRLHELRESNRRFAVIEDAPAVIPSAPKRYRFFASAEQAKTDPVVGPMMDEENERERVGLPPRFSLL